MKLRDDDFVFCKMIQVDYSLCCKYLSERYNSQLKQDFLNHLFQTENSVNYQLNIEKQSCKYVVVSRLFDESCHFPNAFYLFHKLLHQNSCEHIFHSQNNNFQLIAIYQYCKIVLFPTFLCYKSIDDNASQFVLCSQKVHFSSF